MSHIAMLTHTLQAAIIRDPLVVSPNTTVVDAIAQMRNCRTSCDSGSPTFGQPSALYQQARASCVIVVDQVAEETVDQMPSQMPVQMSVIGILTEWDLIQFSTQHRPLHELAVGDVMATSVITVPETLLTDLQSAITLLQQHRVRHLPIVNSQNQLVGIVTHEILEHWATVLEPAGSNRVAILQSKDQREQLLLNTTSQIQSSLSLPTILEQTVNQIRQVMGCDRVTIWQFESDGHVAVVAESTDLQQRCLGERICDPCYDNNSVEIYRQGRVRVVNDIYTTEMADCHRDLLIRLQIRAKVLVPLLCGDRLWGLLAVTESQQPREWQAEEIEWLQALAVQLAIALQQTTTNQQLQTELHARQLAESRNRAIVEALPDLLLRLRRDGTCLDVVASHTPHRGTFLSIQHHLSEVLTPDLLDQQLKAIEQTLATQQIQVYEQVLDKNGIPTYEEIRVTPIQGTDDEVLVVVRDITHRKQAEQALKQVIEGTAAVTGDDFFAKLVQHIALALDVRYVSVTKTTPAGSEIIAFHTDSPIPLPPDLTHVVVPLCARTLVGGYYHYPNSLQEHYPNNEFFKLLKIESYMGLSLRNTANQPIGSLCIFHDRPLDQVSWVTTLLDIFAARAAAELERQQALNQLEQLNNDLEQRVTERTAELEKLAQRHTVALRSGDLGYWEWDLATDEMVWDERLFVLHGILQGPLTYEEFLSTVHPDDLESLELLMQRSLAGDVHYDNQCGRACPYEVIYRSIHPNGTTAYLKAYGSV
ncbi:MAG: GAF domain-containing protein, partial [Leptolyngbyaceae cyanobacterium]